MADEPKIPEAFTVLRPGDRVLLKFAEDGELKHVQGVMDFLRERFPDVEFSAIAGGVEQIIVQPKEQP